MITAIKEDAKTIEKSDTALIKDAPSHGHLELCSIILSAYNNLLPVIGDRDSTLEFISKAMMDGINNISMQSSLALMLKACKDNPDRLRSIFSWLMEQYGTTFEWTSPHEENEEEDSFSIEVYKCFYFNFFKSHGVPFLTPILCQLDSLWFDMVNPQKHGFYFDKTRYRTQGYGAPKCVFPIVQEK
ncbi:MAG: L-2-amino-thiazoline-4-carboxylic acid hydrolase [Deltaproteobacteria bacterium]